MAKTKALISFAVTAKLLCVFVFAYANIRFSHVAAHVISIIIDCHSSLCFFLSVLAPTTKQTPYCFDVLNDCNILNQTTETCSEPERARKICAELCGLCSTGTMLPKPYKKEKHTKGLRAHLFAVDSNGFALNKTSYFWLLLS